MQIYKDSAQKYKSVAAREREREREREICIVNHSILTWTGYTEEEN
jgi:hypothetical protein